MFLLRFYFFSNVSYTRYRFDKRTMDKYCKAYFLVQTRKNILKPMKDLTSASPVDA